MAAAAILDFVKLFFLTALFDGTSLKLLSRQI